MARANVFFPPYESSGCFFVCIFVVPVRGQPPCEFFGFSDRALRLPYSTGCELGEEF